MKVELCPECGSGKVALTSALASTYSCYACMWSGKQEELIVTEMDAATLGIAMAISQAYLIELTREAAIPMGRAMIKAGVIAANQDKAVVAKLVRAAVTGAHRATLEAINSMQERLADGSRS